MVTVQDIEARCAAITKQYGLGQAHTNDLLGLSTFVVLHCQQIVAACKVDSPYEKPWGGHS